MTREEAYSKWLDIDESVTPLLIDEIYDDFESRICKNCKYWIQEEQNDQIRDDKLTGDYNDINRKDGRVYE